MRAREFDNSKLVVFDIDDTLVNTNTLVNVVRDGEVVKQLNSHDFTHYHLQPGEEFDFGRFRDAREFYTNARPIAPMISRLKQDIATGNKVIMLTARADFNDRDVFLDTFRQYGIDMDRVHVYRAGNLQTRAATEEKKKIILRHLLGKQHYDKVIMYDDSVPNLTAFLSLSQDYPWSRFYAWHVDPKGRATEYHRTGASLGNPLREEDEDDLPSVERARAAIPQILARVQQDYDRWDEQDRDTYAGGGICHIIADTMCDVLGDLGIDCTPVSCSYEQHVYIAARFAEGVYTIDIPYHVYETGGGFSWQKIPDVRFSARDVVFYRMSGDPEDWRDYIDEGFRGVTNFVRNIGRDADAPIVMMTNPANRGARTASNQRISIEDFPLKTVAVAELRPWESMIKMQDLPSKRTVANLIQTLKKGGRIPPLLVTPVRGGYRIIDGHHRYAALQRAGIDRVAVRVVDPRLIRYSDEVMEALRITLERYGHLGRGQGGVAEGRISDLDIDLQDQQWEAVVGFVQDGVRRGRDADRMSLDLYRWAGGEMFDVDAELERRGFRNVADLADHIREHGGRYVPPQFDLSGAASLRDIERLERRRNDDVQENFADGRVKGRSRPGRVKRAGASCQGSVTDLRARAKKYGGERGRMYHWCANMKSGRKK